MQKIRNYDVAVIGSGPGGYRAAVLGALRGLKVAIIERGQWGGCCLNRGCVPKKTWYHTARMVALSRHFAKRGLHGELRASFEEAWIHQQGVVDSIRDSYLSYLKRLNISTYNGRACLRGTRDIEITEHHQTAYNLSADHIIIATGSRPNIPSLFKAIPGKVLTTDMLFNNPPPRGKKLALVGSGVVAVELAFILTMLGMEVIWLTRSRLLKHQPFSPQARMQLEQALAEYGIKPYTNSLIKLCETHDQGVTLTLEGDERMHVDWVCLGTGRIPYTYGLGLEQAGIEVNERGFIKRNQYLQTSIPSIYAIGDVASRWMSANHAMADATLAVNNILSPQSQAQDNLRIPLVIYSALEMAYIGMNEDKAEQEGYEPAVGFSAFESSPCALGQGDTRGFVRLLADLDTGTFLGGEIVGHDAGELIHLLSIAPDPDQVLALFARGRFNHPARAEELLNASETLAYKWRLGGIL